MKASAPRSLGERARQTMEETMKTAFQVEEGS